MSYQVKTEDLTKVISITLTAEQLETIGDALEMYCIGLAEHNDPHLKYAADAQNVIINAIESNFGIDSDDDYTEIDADCNQLPISDLKIVVGSDMPEYIQIEYITNGHQGGDAGYGGYATLKIHAGSCGAIVSLNGNNPQEIDGGDIIEITVKGDWEITGFAEAFIELGKKLLERVQFLLTHQAQKCAFLPLKCVR